MNQVSSVTNNLEQLLEKMWQDYIGLSPQAMGIHNFFVSRGDTVVNDHIALRTFNDPRVGIDVLAKAFIESGYVKSGEYSFDVKKLKATHFQHPDPKMPKIFISELLLEKFSTELQAIVDGLISQVSSELTKRFDFTCSGRPWNLSFLKYELLREESEYAAWLAAIGYRPNHFTVSVNELNSMNDLEQLNTLIKSEGYTLNASGGEIKGSSEILLEQSSTLADKIEVTFTDDIQVVPSCYYEFAKRYPLENGELYQGFVAASADKIFESTNKQ